MRHARIRPGFRGRRGGIMFSLRDPDRIVSRLRRGLLLGCSFGAVSSVPAMAPVATQLEEITVTAQKRAENVPDVPLAVTALSGAALEPAGLPSLVDLARTSAV